MVKSFVKRSQRLRTKSEAKESKANTPDKKRSSKQVENEKTVKRRKIDDTHDSYCWKCHKFMEVNENECSTCPRVFHDACLKAKFIDGSCLICDELSKYDMPEVHLTKLLQEIIQVTCPMNKDKNKNLANLQNSDVNLKLCRKKVFGFGYLYDRVMKIGVPYKSDRELIDDLEWIQHNCVIIYGEKSLEVKNIKEVLADVTKELDEAMGCPECYFKKNDKDDYFYLHICKRPHPIVWAQMKFFQPWPAKCYKVTNGKAFVRFFGRHDMGKVPLKQCFFISKESPSKKKPTNDLVYAQEQVKAYISIFNDHFNGKFPYKEVNTAFDFQVATDEIEELLNEYPQNGRVNDCSTDVVNLTDSEDDDTVMETDSSTRPESRTLFDDQSQFEIHDGPPSEAALTNADTSTNDGNVDNAQTFLDNICSTDNIIKEGFQAVHYEGFPAGHILPGYHSEDWLNQPIQSESDIDPSMGSIAISSVMSGDRPNLDLNTQLTNSNEGQNSYIMRLASERDNYPSNSGFAQSSASSSDRMQICYRNYDRASAVVIPSSAMLEDDGDCQIIEEVSSVNNPKQKKKSYDAQCVLQNILKHDPKSHSILKDANIVFENLFVRFWAAVGRLKTPEIVIEEQVSTIKDLESQVDELKKEIAFMKKDYETRLNNADRILKMKLGENIELDKKIKALSKSYEESLKAAEDNFNEKIWEAKANVYCSNCRSIDVRVSCCKSKSGLRMYVYCSEECKVKDLKTHKNICTRNSSEQKSEERNQSTMAGSMAYSVASLSIEQTITQRTTHMQSVSCNEIASLNIPQQKNSAVGSIVQLVSEKKKSGETAKTGDRSFSSDMLY